MDAKVHSYLAVLTAANVRGMLRRVAQRRAPNHELANGAQTQRELSNDSRASEPRMEGDLTRRDLRRRPADTRQDVLSWEDDGGRVREAP